MQGDVVSAAKWLGGCLVAASLVVAVSLHTSAAGRQTAPAGPPAAVVAYPGQAPCSFVPVVPITPAAPAPTCNSCGTTAFTGPAAGVPQAVTCN